MVANEPNVQDATLNAIVHSGSLNGGGLLYAQKLLWASFAIHLGTICLDTIFLDCVFVFACLFVHPPNISSSTG